MSWLRTVRANPETLDDVLLEGHLNLIKELLTHVPAQIKYQYGAHPEHRDSGLIKVSGWLLTSVGANQSYLWRNVKFTSI